MRRSFRVYEVWFDSAASAGHSFHTFKTAVGIAATPAGPRTPPHPRRHTPLRHRHPQLTKPLTTSRRRLAQTRALHFSKGCYLGQEIVERIRSRGNVHRTFSGFSLTGVLPAPGVALTAEGKPVGELTSVAAIPLPESSTQPARTIQLALGYVRREALDRNLPLEYPGGVATPIALPYPIS